MHQYSPHPSPRHVAQASHAESLDYEPIQNKLYCDRIRRSHSTRHFYGYTGLTLAKFVVMICTGVGTGFIAVALSKATSLLMDWKNSVVQNLLSGNDDMNPLILSWAFHVGYTVFLATLAGTLVQTWAPAAAGAGVTLVMAHLNGNQVPHLLESRTLLIKFVGTLCGVAGGMAMGPEGPMVHLGACMASVMAHAHCEWLRSLPLFGCGRSRPPIMRPSSPTINPRAPSHPAGSMLEAGSDCDADSDVCSNADMEMPDPLPRRRPMCPLWDALFSDVEHREFVAAGAACGITAAFGAPVGGVLFSLEEACSFWSKKVAWRCLLSCLFAAFTIGQMSPEGESAGMLQLTDIQPLHNRDWLLQLPFMALATTASGLLGAVFNLQRRFLWKIRAYREQRLMRLLEVIGVAVVTITWAFATSTAFGQCMKRPPSWTAKYGPQFGMRYLCPEGQHNDLATMFLSLPDHTLRSMFSVGEQPATHAAEDSGFSLPSLLLFSGSWLALMALGSGIAVPGGLFMPSLLLGSSFGLAFGMLLQQLLPSSPFLIQPGLYALICATAALGGVFRAALSLVVIMLEGTRGINFMLAIILAVACSNGIAKLIHKDGVYESELERDGNVSFLRHEPPHRLLTKTASDIMASPVYGFRQVERVSTVLSVLRGTNHHGFPVFGDVPADTPVAMSPSKAAVELGGGVGIVRKGRLEGTVLRSQLMVLLQRKIWCNSQGVLLSPGHARSRDKLEQQLENEMRLFYRTNHTQNRHLAVADGSLHRVARSLQRLAGSFSRAAAAHRQMQEPLLSHCSIPACNLELDGCEGSDRGEEEAGPSSGEATPGSGAGAEGAGQQEGAGSFQHAGVAGLEERAVEGTCDSPFMPAAALPPTAMPCVHFQPGGNGAGGEAAGVLDSSWMQGVEDVYLDLTPFMNQAPLAVRREASAARCHHLFVTLGMRHLCVVDAFNCVVGIITRKDLDSAAGRGGWRTTRMTSPSQLRPSASRILTSLPCRILAAISRPSRIESSGPVGDSSSGAPSSPGRAQQHADSAESPNQRL